MSLGNQSEEYQEWVEAGAPEPTAAEPYYDGRGCEYPDCNNPGEWIIEVEGRQTFRCCDACGQSKRIYPEDLASADLSGGGAR